MIILKYIRLSDIFAVEFLMLEVNNSIFDYATQECCSSGKQIHETFPAADRNIRISWNSYNARTITNAWRIDDSFPRMRSTLLGRNYHTLLLNENF